MIYKNYTLQIIDQSRAEKYGFLHFLRTHHKTYTDLKKRKTLNVNIIIATWKLNNNNTLTVGINTQIWRGTWRQTKVAVKIYKKEDEHFWLRELDIYQTRMVRHEHILGYIASDIKGKKFHKKFSKVFVVFVKIVLF